MIIHVAVYVNNNNSINSIFNTGDIPGFLGAFIKLKLVIKLSFNIKVY